MGKSWPELTPDDDDAIRDMWCNKLAQYFWDATSKCNNHHTCTDLERHLAQRFLISSKKLPEICASCAVDPDFVRGLARGLKSKKWPRPRAWSDRSALAGLFFGIAKQDRIHTFEDPSDLDGGLMELDYYIDTKEAFKTEEFEESEWLPDGDPERPGNGVGGDFLHRH